ncbi:MAG: hypothetical protein RLZ59_1209 [Pseudomonadota bacterium]|jgi:hypothetical protein
MVWTERFRRVVLGCGAFAMLGGAAALHAADLSVLRKIEPGLWDIQSKDVRDGGRTMCVADPLVLTQLAHPGLACTRFVISSTENSVAVHYSCAGTGSGQTEIRVETPRLLQIETQGMVRQTPFQWRYEARRIGECTGMKK